VVFYDKIAPAVIGIVVIVGGGLVWVLGRSAVHIGASGLIYGIAAFLIVYGFIIDNLFITYLRQ
jgi:membrane associated rhomboid family serine protease